MAVFSGNGSVGSPSFTFSSDTDSGMYRVGDNSIALGTGGVEKLTLAAGGVTINDSGTAGNTFRVKAGSVSDAFVIKSGGVGIYSDDPQAPLFVESGDGEAPGPNVLVAARGGGNADILGTFGFYNTASQTTSNPIRAYATATRQNGNWGANLDLYASTGTGAATRRMRLTATGATQLFNAADTEMFRLDSAGDFSFGGDIAGGDPRYRYDESVNIHYINTAAGATPSNSGSTRLSIRGGGIRIQSEGSEGAGSWVTNNFSLAASEADTPVMSLSTYFGNLSNAQANALILISIHARWPGAPNNSTRLFYGYITQLQNSFNVTSIFNSYVGDNNSWTLTTAASGGTQTLRLTNNSATYPMNGSISMLLLGGMAPSYGLNAL